MSGVIAIDGMGGDDAPAAIVAGALEAAREGIEVALVGDQAILERELIILDPAKPPSTLRIVHASDAIEMGDHAALEARTRRDSSIYIGLQLVRRGEAQAFVSLGNTGAVYALSLVLLGRIKGIERPALGAVFPIPSGPVLVLDVGANAEVRPNHLEQFARLGVAYMREVMGVRDPSVGLLNIGEEPTKGTPDTIAANELIAASGLRFVGNVEGRQIFEHAADVVVADGFTGNVVLKTTEGVVDITFSEIRKAANSTLRAKLGGMLLRPALRGMAQKMDYRQYGAAPLLGVDGVVFIGHGRSDGHAVANAIRTAAVAVDRRLREVLTESVGTPASSAEQSGTTEANA
ncbi:MAG: phosphate acyltransferase PlsX [Chloroflexi bacterium]|nr:MAG: phosphate acyltransferase PlsX [Chloroflexota bacterium]